MWKGRYDIINFRYTKHPKSKCSTLVDKLNQLRRFKYIMCLHVCIWSVYCVLINVSTAHPLRAHLPVVLTKYLGLFDYACRALCTIFWGIADMMIFLTCSITSFVSTIKCRIIGDLNSDANYSADASPRAHHPQIYNPTKLLETVNLKYRILQGRALSGERVVFFLYFVVYP